MSWHAVFKPFVSEGVVLFTPELFELHVGVTPAPLKVLVIPEICQSLASCFRTGMLVNVGTL